MIALNKIRTVGAYHRAAKRDIRSGEVAPSAVAGVPSDRDYFVDVRGGNLDDRDARYVVEVDFAQDSTHLQTFVNTAGLVGQPLD